MPNAENFPVERQAGRSNLEPRNEGVGMSATMQPR
jgi:hypothetical protein